MRYCWENNFINKIIISSISSFFLTAMIEKTGQKKSMESQRWHNDLRFRPSESLQSDQSSSWCSVSTRSSCKQILEFSIQVPTSGTAMKRSVANMKLPHWSKNYMGMLKSSKKWHVSLLWLEWLKWLCRSIGANKKKKY